MGQKASTILNCCWRRTLHIGNMRRCPLEACNLDTGKPLLARQRLGDWPTDCWQCLNQNGYGIYIYIYIYILDSHMAPYGACEVAQSTARSKAQFEAERFRRGSRRKNMHGRKCFRRKKKHARAMLSKAQWPQSTFEQCFRVLSGLEGKRSMLEH